MIEVFVQDNPLKEFRVLNTDGYLTSLDRINLFIGSNNSGKSRFIRTMFKKLLSGSNTKFIEREADFKDMIGEYRRNIKQEILATLEKILNNYDLPEHEDVSNYRNRLASMPDNQMDFHLFISIANLLVEADTTTYTPHITNPHSQQLIQTLTNDMKKLGRMMLVLVNNSSTSKNVSPDCLYIPVLRGLRPIHYNGETKSFDSTDVYSTRTIKDYFPKPGTGDGNVSQKIFSGLTLYEDITKLLLGTVQERQIIKEFEEYLSEHIFHGEEITLIPKFKEDVLHIKIGEDDQYPIYNLGDGIQTLIAILFPVFIRREKQAYIFMEEPEIHLHPKLQRLLIDALKTMSNHQYFISTHSAIFMNTPDTCTYEVSKKEDGFLMELVTISSSKRKLLESLGYKASDILLSNFILWVEGATDKLYFEYWIQKFSDGELKMNKHYDIMMYHGSYEQHIDLDAFFSMSPHYGIYIDSDRISNSRKHSPTAKLALEQQIVDSGHYCWVSRKRAIENYIPYLIYLEAIQQVHAGSELELVDGDFIDRGLANDKIKKPEFKPRIKLPNDIWSIVQKNKNGTTTGIESRRLRSAIESAIKESSNTLIRIDKLRVAEKVILLKPELEDKELKQRIKELAKEIKLANQMEV